MKPKAYSYLRFSSKAQEIGDSERRQSEPAEKIAEKLGLPLDDTLHLTDKALSGYTGDNLIKGVLGGFIKMVDEGKITVGSVLIMENLDRLTRLPVLDAEHLLTGILIKGIGIYTWMNQKLLTKETYNVTDSILKSINLDQANQESIKKSDRIGKAWANKRIEARTGIKKMSRGCPMWLELSPDRKKFVLKKEVVSVVKLIFNMKLAGKGSERIVKELNSMNIWKPKQVAWNASTVELYLRNNRKLLGEFQPCRYKRIDGKRKNIPDGEPILNYYPSVINKDLFNRVQDLLKANAKKDGRGGGRADLVNNLFSHIAFCSRCDSTVRYLNKGEASLHGKTQFKCAKVTKGLKCDSDTVYYQEVEQAVLTYCTGLNVSDILPNSENTASELSILQNQLSSKGWELSTVQTSISNLLVAVQKATTDEYRKALEHTFSILNLNKEKLKTEIQDMQEQIQKLSSNGKQTEEQINSIKELIDLMKTLEGQERINLRLNLRNQLRGLIESIKVDSKNNTVVIFFNSGQRRLINLVTSEIIFDANPPKKLTT